MTSSEALAQLTIQAGAIRAMGETSLYLYGSTARWLGLPPCPETISIFSSAA